MIVTLGVEDQAGKVDKGPEPQVGKPQLVRIARRSGRRLLRDVAVGLPERVDKRECNPFTGFDQAVIDGLLDVPVGEFSRDDRLDGLHVAVGLAIRSRSAAKYVPSAAAPGWDLAPASSSPRN